MTENDNLTPSQREAIFSEGTNLLVSASAGSGKTYVMIERVIRLILEGKAEVNEILAVTYTNLAADEMKQKLVSAVIKEINKGGDTQRLKETLAEIPTASFSTFHSFCANQLRAYFYAASVDPLFAVADETEAKELKNRAIDQLFTEKYDSGDEDFLYLVRIYRKHRSDAALKEMILGLSSFAASEAIPENFLSDCAEGVTHEKYLYYGEKLSYIYKTEISALLKQLCALSEECGYPGAEKYDAYVKELIAHAQSVIDAPSPKELYSRAAVKDGKMPIVRVKDCHLSDISERIKRLKGELNDVYGDVCSSLADYGEGGEATFSASSRAVKTLCLLTARFDELYSELKREEGKADFGDLEHLFYKLLVGHPEIADEIKRKYKFVFADEYQDVNGIQEEILKLITDGNLFMVGDVKQSIYAFRGCNPDIFAEKYSEYLWGNGGKCISLDRNFRSSDGVLAAVNNVFSRIMTEEFGGINYAANKMERGGLYPESYGEATLHIIEGERAEKAASEGLYNVLRDLAAKEEDEEFYEGVLTARIIEDELQKQVYDVKLGRERKVALGDIAVLTRTSTGFTTRVVKELTRLGIPVSSESGTSVIEYPEIQLLVCILKLIAFYADDVPLAATLKSAVGKLSEEELAQIRRPYPRKNGNKTFAECVADYEKNGKNQCIRAKLKSFKEYFDKIRLLAEFEGAGEILTRIMKETGLDLEITAMPLGATRIARVERFIAESVKGGKKLTVNEFLNRIETSPESLSLSEASGEDTVRVMSIHASKGLEYPIVIIAGISRKFNFDGVKGEVLADRREGIALKSYDEQSKTYNETLARSYFKEIGKLNTIKEEARVFYVAMTRAKARLHLICDKSVREEPDDYSILTATGFSDFICRQDMPVVVHETSDLARSAGKTVESVLIGAGRQSLSEKILSYLSFDYPYAADTTLPVKRAVTRLTEDAKGASLPVTHAVINEESHSPFSSSTEKGIAYHKFMELCDLQAENAENELIRLLSSGAITKEQASFLDTAALGKALSSPVIKRLEGYDIYREQQFIVPFKADEISDEKTNGEILVQGVIDLIAVRNDEAIIIDYKTSSADAETLKARYLPQLGIYAAAAEKSLGVKVKEKIILNLLTGEFIYL